MPKYKSFIGISALAVIAVLVGTGQWHGALFGVETASAQAISISQTALNSAAGLTLFLIKIFNFLTWFALSILDLIMDPQWIFQINADGTDGSLLNMLHEIWQFNRDLVNLGFAIALVVGAVTMVVTADNTKVKEHLKKYLIAIILVNFSWFIPRVIFDISQVVTYTVYQIPSLLGADGCQLPPTGDDAAPRPCEVVLSYRFLDETNTIGADGTGPGGSIGWRCPLPGIVCTQTVSIRDADANVRTSTKVLDGLIVNHARLQWLAQVDLTSTPVLPPGASVRETITRLGGIIIKLVVVLVIHIALLFPMLAMVAAFFIRIPVLWISMAFMPFVALGFAFESLKNGEGKALFWEWQDHFLKAAFLPAKVAIPFVIGFIMLNAGAQLQPPDNMGNIPLVPIFVGVRDMWQLMWMGIALFIIWHYSFEQLKSDKAGFMGHFTDKIKDIGGSLGNIALQWPLSMPFIPVPGRVDAQGRQETMSINQGLRGIDPRTISRDLSSLGRFDKGSFARNFGLRGTSATEANIKIVSSNTVFLKQANETLRNDAMTQEQLQKVLTDFQKTFADNPSLRGLTGAQILEHIERASPGDKALSERIQKILKDSANDKLLKPTVT